MAIFFQGMKTMFDLKGKIAFITGGSSGIGAACAEQLAQLGCHLILVARRTERLERLAERLIKDYGIEVLPLSLDVRSKKEVRQVIHQLNDHWKKIDILINNAGLALDSLPLQNGNLDHWDTMIQTNINGLLYVTHSVVNLMLEHRAGHIINISSVAGHDYYPTGNVYSATKHAVRALSHSLRLDLLGTGLRVTDIAPGAVNTEFSTVRWQDKEKADKFYADFTPLMADDIADAVIYCVTRPSHVCVSEMLIYPTDQASINHLYRKNGNKIGGMFD